MTIIVGVIGLIGLIVPQIAVQVRRFHDQDLSGLLALLNLIPYIGSLIVLIFMFIEGTRGENKFGADPREQISGGSDDQPEKRPFNLRRALVGLPTYDDPPRKSRTKD